MNDWQPFKIRRKFWHGLSWKVDSHIHLEVGSFLKSNIIRHLCSPDLRLLCGHDVYEYVQKHIISAKNDE